MRSASSGFHGAPVIHPRSQIVIGGFTNIGPMEIAIVLIIALVVFGPKRLPELGKSLGKGIQEFRGTISGDKSEPKETSPAIEPAPVAHGPLTKAEAAAKLRA